ncbi:MAG TPA: GGDEF domain-containing protein [Pseudorhodoplanes sp.]|nr:GGDEF domain-containing protein [Pseudorhodoplanes sp.]HWV40645.1 GGDEF domain-containing protein [Pseudorhodoplanes sp.]
MSNSGDEHKRTMAFAEIALAQIKALRQPANPRNFEVWYSYATGYYPSLNEAVNQLLSLNGNLTEAELEKIYATHLSPLRFSERIDKVGDRVLDEIEQVMAMVDAAVGTTNNCSESLAGVANHIPAADRDGLRGIVESLVQTTKEMENLNLKLEARLVASRKEINELQENLELMRHESQTDPLTSLANRKYFDEALVKVIAEAKADNEAMSLLMTDIDHFKTFNDTYGHLTGDQVLRLVALSVKQNVKGKDIAARYGGEEFAVVLPNTVLRSAVTVADHIRRAVMSKELMKRSTGEHLGRVTISIGVATLQAGDTVQTLIGRADACLYAAKRAGRNRVVCETDPEAKASHEPAAAVA